MVGAGRGGRLVNISGCHDTVPLNLRSAYSISKGGLAMLTKSLALELAEHRIAVNAVSPGAILTDMNSASLSKPEPVSGSWRAFPPTVSAAWMIASAP